MARTFEQILNTLDNVLADLDEIKKDKPVNDTKIGHTFQLAGLQWKVLDVVDGGYLCLTEKLDSNMKFDEESNNWETSKLREYLNGEFHNMLAANIGSENIIPFTRNLLSLDGQTEYGRCEDKVSLLTVDEYRKYRDLIPNANYWWWLITPWSTKCNGYTNWSAVVSPQGFVIGDICDNRYGVRPLCIFSSKIFESKG